MTNAENTESKRNADGVSNASNEITEQRPLNEDTQDGHRLEENSSSSTEGNPLLDSDRKSSSIKVDVPIKLKRDGRDEEDRASMNTSRKDPESDDRNANVPPDGGLRAWMIMIGSFVINGVLFSVINTYSLIYLELQKRLLESGETAASSKAGESCNLIISI